MSEVDTEYSEEDPGSLASLDEGQSYTANMNIAVKTERGYTLSRDYGFTIEEEDGKVLAFDILNHEELGTTLLFGNQVFALKFWDVKDLTKGLKIFTEAVESELKRRGING